jgi:hypothetical protein
VSLFKTVKVSYWHFMSHVLKYNALEDSVLIVLILTVFFPGNFGIISTFCNWMLVFLSFEKNVFDVWSFMHSLDLNWRQFKPNFKRLESLKNG